MLEKQKNSKDKPEQRDTENSAKSHLIFRVMPATALLYTLWLDESLSEKNDLSQKIPSPFGNTAMYMAVCNECLFFLRKALNCVPLAKEQRQLYYVMVCKTRI